MNLPGAKTLTRTRQNRPRTILLIRTVAGPSIGFGHLRRSLILARHICGYARPVFLLDRTDPWSRRQTALCGFASLSFETNHPWPAVRGVAGVLVDTRQRAGLRHLIAEARRHGAPVISMHDLGLAPLPSDISIDGSILPGHARSGTAFNGTDYLVLEDICAEYHRKSKKIGRRIQRVAINLGGGDGRRFFARILQGLRAAGRKLQVVGFPGFCSWGQDVISGTDWGSVKFRWIDPQEIAAKVIFESDLVISAGGLSAYEALCLGTPVCALAYDQYQEITVTALAHAGAAVNLGRGEALESAGIAAKFLELDDDYSRRRRLSRRGRELVDGNGTRRVARILRTIMQDAAIPPVKRAGNPSACHGLKESYDTRTHF